MQPKQQYLWKYFIHIAFMLSIYSYKALFYRFSYFYSLKNYQM